MHLIDTSLAYWVARRLGRPTKRLWYPAHLTPDIKVVDGKSLPFFDDWQVLVTAQGIQIVTCLYIIHKQDAFILRI